MAVSALSRQAIRLRLPDAHRGREGTHVPQRQTGPAPASYEWLLDVLTHAVPPGLARLHFAGRMA
jgi:hypothetical protein